MLLTATPAFAQDTGSPAPDLSIPINLLWVVIGAVLVIFMQAGFALVETGFCRAKHAAHVVSTNFAIFGLGFVAYFLVGYTFMFGGYSFSPLGLRQADRQRADRERQLGVPLEGRLRPRWLRCLHRGRDGVLPLHGRLHGHHGNDPDRRDGRALEVERVRRVGPLLRRALLPAVRRVDLGRRLARQLGQEHAPRLRLHRLRGLWCRARDGWDRRSCGSS